MHYSSSRPGDFEFHDAVMTLESLAEGRLTVSVKALNLHAAAEQNDQPTDMEISHARMTFHDFRVLTFEPGRAWRRDAKGALYTDDPLIVYQGADAEEHLLEELRSGLCVYAFQADGKSRYHLEACGTEPWFAAQFTASAVFIEWDEFRRPAWYTR